MVGPGYGRTWECSVPLIALTNRPLAGFPRVLVVRFPRQDGFQRRSSRGVFARLDRKVSQRALGFDQTRSQFGRRL